MIDEKKYKQYVEDYIGTIPLKTPDKIVVIQDTTDFSDVKVKAIYNNPNEGKDQFRLEIVFYLENDSLGSDDIQLCHTPILTRW